MDLRTEAQYRNELAEVWGMLDAERRAHEWQPIETKPQGQTLLYYPAVAGRNALSEWITIGYDSAPRRATHWMPLPAPLNARSKRRRRQMLQLAQKQRAGVRLTELLGGGAHCLLRGQPKP